MMQAANVKSVTNQALVNKAINHVLIQKAENTTENTKVKSANLVELTKSQSFNRFLEAYSDCV